MLHFFSIAKISTYTVQLNHLIKKEYHMHAETEVLRY